MAMRNRLEQTPFEMLHSAGGVNLYAAKLKNGLDAAKRKNPTKNRWDAYEELIYALEGVYIDSLYPDISQQAKYCRAYMYRLIDEFCKGEEQREILFMAFGYLEGYELLLLGKRREEYRKHVSPNLGSSSVGKIWLDEEDAITKELSHTLSAQIEDNHNKLGLLDGLNLEYVQVKPHYYTSSPLAGRGREKKSSSEKDSPSHDGLNSPPSLGWDSVSPLSPDSPSLSNGTDKPKEEVLSEGALSGKKAADRNKRGKTMLIITVATLCVAGVFLFILLKPSANKSETDQTVWAESACSQSVSEIRERINTDLILGKHLEMIQISMMAIQNMSRKNMI